MNAQIQSMLIDITAASSVLVTEKLQTLWSGYGELLRVHMNGGNYRSVIVKHIQLPHRQHHPRGWHTPLSHQRKLTSYQVESYWYSHYANLCDEQCPVPSCIHLESSDDELVIVMSDLAERGFTENDIPISNNVVYACLKWLAKFHATFLDSPSTGLWPTGTYWHLATRPDELDALTDIPLKTAAPHIDQILQRCRYQTLVHGDAKIANFCFKTSVDIEGDSSVAAVDFQYIGRGCGMKDIAYFLGSCLSEKACEAHEQQFLDYYFSQLTQGIADKHPSINAADVEAEWRPLFDVAWADFHRFLKGWSTQHWKINSYSERLCRRVIARIMSEQS